MINNFIFLFSIVIFGFMGLLCFAEAVFEGGKESIALFILSCAFIAVSVTILIEFKGGC